MKNINKQTKDDNLSEEAAANLAGFFSLLLKIDKRINPQNYKKIK